MTNNDLLKTATKAAEAAGKLLMENFDKAQSVSYKQDKSVVSRTDMESEKLIVSTIGDAFPEHGIIAEESRYPKKYSDYTWVIDPLDGTSNYVLGMPFFSVGIALMHRGEVVMSVVDEPFVNKLYHAESGSGAFLNGKKIGVSEKEDLDKCIFGFSRGRGKEKTVKFAGVLSRIIPKIGTPRILGSLILSLAYVSAGKLDGVIDYGSNIWDVASGAFLVKEAGGKITDLDNRPWGIDSANVLASNGKIHNDVLKIIGG